MRKSSKCLSDFFSLQIDWAKSCCETSCSIDVIDSFHTFAKMVDMIVHSVLRDKRNDDAPSFFSIANKATATSELLYHFEDSIREKILLESRSKRPTKWERLLFMQSLTNTSCKQCVFLEEFASHMRIFLWRIALSMLCYREANPFAVAKWRECYTIWGACLEGLSMRCIRNSATGWRGNIFHVEIEGCRFPLRPRCDILSRLSALGELRASALPTVLQGESRFIFAHGKPGNGKTLRCDKLLRALDPPSSGCRADTTKGVCKGKSLVTIPNLLIDMFIFVIIKIVFWKGFVSLIVMFILLFPARPDLSSDLLVGTTTKRLNGRLLSLQAYLQYPLNWISNDSLLLFDDFDQACVPLFKMSREPERHNLYLKGSKVQGYVPIQPTASILRVMEILRQRARDFRFAGSKGGNKMLVLVTGSDDRNLRTTMFDQVLELNSPKEEERREAVLKVFFPGEAFSHKGGQFEECLDAISVATRGRTWSELLQKCRDIFLNESGERNAGAVVDDIARLRSIGRAFEGIAVNSTQNKLIAQDSVGITILGPNDLARAFLDYRNEVQSGALLPWEQSHLWAQLEAGILTPFCNSLDLHHLFRHGNQDAESTNRQSLAGVLLTGASGSGKTSIARHCAAVASSVLPALCLIDVNCVSLVRKELGESERAIRQLFDLAKNAAPCVMVLDGIDNIATTRGKDNSTHGTMDRMLSTLLTQMDGLQGASVQPAIIGITVQSDWVDQAVLRPGRLAKTIRIVRSV